MSRGKAKSWPVLLLALPAFIAIWSGWVDLGRLTGFGVVHPLPGIWDSARINTAITLPIGLETYAAYALYVWLASAVPLRARRFAKWSAIGSLALGAAGQVAYHLMIAAGMTTAPWQITTVVACLPVVVLGMGAALAHLVHDREGTEVSTSPVDAVDPVPAGVPSGPVFDHERPIGPLPAPVTSPVDNLSTPELPARKPHVSSEERVVKAHRRTPSATNEELARRLNLSTKTVSRYRPKPAEQPRVNGRTPEFAEGVKG
jgi:hypothetical protein